MKKIIYNGTLILSLLCSSALYSACSSPDELVPFPEEESSTSQVYKMPDPVILNDSETAIVNDIQKEYIENVAQ